MFDYRKVKSSMKTTTVRIPEEDFEILEIIAAAQGVSVSDVMRSAISELIEKCHHNDSFRTMAQSVAANLQAKSERIINRLDGTT